MGTEHWFIETTDSHTNKVFWGEVLPDALRMKCADGQEHDLLPVSKKIVERALLSKSDQHLLFDVFCQVGFASPKRVNLKKKASGSKKYRDATRALKGQLSRKAAQK